MAMSGRTSSSKLAAAVLALAATVLLFATNAHALEIVNKQSCTLTVFAPPICEPCKCPQIQCIRAPCIQPECFCTLQCKYVDGVEVQIGTSVTLAVKNDLFPLGFLTVEANGVVYIVKAADLKCITRFATVVVTRNSCGKGKEGVVALVYQNPKFTKFKSICLVRGERYGS